MITTQAILKGDRNRLLGFDPAEHPVAVQLGGHDPVELAAAARIAADFGYDEVNLNVGCPSGRVQAGGFGACLMTDAALVARCVRAMREAVSIPVTVKSRIGVDDHDSYSFLADFVAEVAGAGCDVFVLHARKAVLKGFSPRNNRAIPPLSYSTVYRLKRDFPALRVVVNGGIRTIEEITGHLAHVDGVMLGRKVWDDPFFLTRVRTHFFGLENGGPGPDRETVIRRMYAYARRETRAGVRLHQVTRHMLGLYRGVPGGRKWRRFISEHAIRRDAAPEVLIESLAAMPVAAAEALSGA